MARPAYPSDISDDEWAFVAPYVTLMTEEAPQRDHSLREVLNGLRWLGRAGAAWRGPLARGPWASQAGSQRGGRQTGQRGARTGTAWHAPRRAAGPGLPLPRARLPAP